MTPEPLSAVPHLTTALSGPLQQIESHLILHQARIEAWLRTQWQLTRAPFYTSVDLRNSGFKLAPVDTNLFPAGFNNLNGSFIPLCVHAVQSAMEKYCPDACRVLVVPENHTRNLFYLESLAALRDILLKAGFEVRIGSLLPDLEGPLAIDLPSGGQIRLEPVVRQGNRLQVEQYDPCVIVLNNDLTAGRPAPLEGLEQPIVPPMELGWNKRRKSAHFTHYQDVAREFSNLVDFDPWLIDPLFRNCGEIDFMKREGEDCLARNANILLEAITLKYAEYGIEQTPFVVMKGDSGTYGMNVMMVQSADELRQLNRKQRTKMAVSKEGRKVTKVIIQEGVATLETWGPQLNAAEPVVYMIDHFVVGGFYRVHTQRGPRESLNAPGMQFEPLAFADSCVTPDPDRPPDDEPNRFYAYGVIARLALVAAARELAELT